MQRSGNEDNMKMSTNSTLDLDRSTTHRVQQQQQQHNLPSSFTTEELDITVRVINGIVSQIQSGLSTSTNTTSPTCPCESFYQHYQNKPCYQSLFEAINPLVNYFQQFMTCNVKGHEKLSHDLRTKTKASSSASTHKRKHEETTCEQQQRDHYLEAIEQRLTRLETLNGLYSHPQEEAANNNASSNNIATKTTDFGSTAANDRTLKQDLQHDDPNVVVRMDKQRVVAARRYQLNLVKLMRQALHDDSFQKSDIKVVETKTLSNINKNIISNISYNIGPNAYADPSTQTMFDSSLLKFTYDVKGSIYLEDDKCFGFYNANTARDHLMLAIVSLMSPDLLYQLLQMRNNNTGVIVTYIGRKPKTERDLEETIQSVIYQDERDNNFKIIDGSIFFDGVEQNIDKYTFTLPNQSK